MNGPLAGGDAGRTVGDALVESRCDSACYEEEAEGARHASGRVFDAASIAGRAEEEKRAALLSSPALDVRLLTALQVLQVHQTRAGGRTGKIEEPQRPEG